MNALAAARLIDDLYRRAVEDASAVDDVALAGWTAEVAELAGSPDREVGRLLRRVVRDARKLARYWSERDPSTLPDWRNGVDEALGSRGWSPQLDLLSAALERQPSPELFAETAARYRSVHFRPWLEGIGYEEWLASRPPRDDADHAGR